MFRRKKTIPSSPLMKAIEDILAPERCLNCGATVTARFCPECGQEHSQKVVSIWRLVSDFLEDVFSWDSKVFRTVGRLLFVPGLLTEEYNRGRRARYLSPFRLYLYASALMFYLMSVQVGTLNLGSTGGKGRRGEAGATLGQSLTVNGHNGKAPKTPAEYQVQQSHLPPGKRDPALVRSMVLKGLSMRNQRTEDVIRKDSEAAVRNAPTAMFLLLPVFALLLKLIYMRRGRLYIEHLVFALHCHAFVFTLLSVLLVWGAMGRSAPGWLNNTVAAAIAVYLLVAMKRVYRQGWFKTAAKLGILSVAYTVLLACVGAGVLVYTFLTA